MGISQFRVRSFVSVGSTMVTAKDLLSSEGYLFDAVIAASQTHGYGRMGREWLAPAAFNLNVTYVVPDAPQPWIKGFCMAVAVAESIDQELGESCAELRWPNDVLVASRKIAGILVEASPNSPTLIGVGVNVNWIDAPKAIEDTAVSLRRLTARQHSTPRLAELIWERFNALPEDEWAVRWAPRDATSGKPYVAPDGRTGVALSVLSTGLLQIRWSDGHIGETPAAEIK